MLAIRASGRPGPVYIDLPKDTQAGEVTEAIPDEVHIPGFNPTLQPNPLQVRTLIKSENLVDLVESIKEHGIIEPLVVAKTPAGFQIIAGERRWRAAKIVGLKTVPVVVKETTTRGMLELAIIENIQREDEIFLIPTINIVKNSKCTRGYRRT